MPAMRARQTKKHNQPNPIRGVEKPRRQEQVSMLLLKMCMLSVTGSPWYTEMCTFTHSSIQRSWSPVNLRVLLLASQ